MYNQKLEDAVFNLRILSKRYPQIKAELLSVLKLVQGGLFDAQQFIADLEEQLAIQESETDAFNAAMDAYDYFTSFGE